jgi:hypothetical protein
MRIGTGSSQPCQVDPVPTGPTVDEAAVLALLARPMGGAVRLALTRSPSPRLAAEVEGDRYRLVTAEEPRTGTLLGMGVRTVRNVYLDGKAARVGYLSQLRVAGKVGLGRWRRGFRELLAARAADEIDFDLTSIASDNLAARRLLERGLPGLPPYREIGQIETLVFSTARGAPRGGDNGGGTTPENLVAVANRLESDRRRYVLAPRWAVEDFEAGGRCLGLKREDFLVAPAGEVQASGGDRSAREAGIQCGALLRKTRGALRRKTSPSSNRRGVSGQEECPALDPSFPPPALPLGGCAAIWDQRAYKQVVVAGYARWLALLRPLLNPLRSWRGQPRLPSPGTTLALAYLSHFSADDAGTAISLLDAACARARARNLDQLALSLSTRHPLLPALAQARAPQRFRTTLYAVGGNATDLDRMRQGILHLEGATL